MLSPQARSKHPLQLHRRWQQEDRTRRCRSASTGALHWHRCVHTGGWEGLPRHPDWLPGRGGLLAVHVENTQGDAERREMRVDKAERKSPAHHRRSSRRRRSCPSGRCRGRRPWSGGPGREPQVGRG